MMWQNFFKTSVRSLFKRKLYTFINIGGLAIGIACFILLFLFLQNEWTYDRFHTNGKQLFRISSAYGEIDQPLTHTALTPSALAPALKTVPEVQTITRIYPKASLVANGEKAINESRFIYAEAPFFTMFSFPLLEGDPATALSGPNMVVLSASMAEKYFGKSSPTGKMLKIDGKDFMVTGVAKNPPSNTHLKFDFVGSYSSMNITDRWGSANYYTYIQLADKATSNALHDRLTSMIKGMMGSNTKYRFDLIPEPIADIHLYSQSENSTERGGNLQYDYMLAIIAVLLLAVACINFMNLATARSADRAREIGVRKVMGAVKRELFTQFITESAIITFLALVIGTVLSLVLLPWFNNLTQSTIRMHLEWPLIVALVTVFVATTFLAGAYPAFFLANFKPVQVLKGKTPAGKGAGLRKTLVVFQFAAAVFFIICTLVVGQQLYYIQHKKLGQDRSQVVVLNGSRLDNNSLAAFKTRLLQQSEISQVSASYDSPVDIGGGYGIGQIQGKPADYSMDVTAIPVEKDYLQTMGIDILAGEKLTDADIQDVTREKQEDRRYHFYLNETAVKQLGWTPTEAVGRTMTMNGRIGSVKGVMRDFHFASMKQKIQPLIVFPEYEWFGEILVKVNGRDPQRVLANIEDAWKSYQPGRPFDAHFLDDDFNAMYESEFRAGRLLKVFSGLVILVSCLGLIGLAAFTAEQRTRELGIRKVLGASSSNLVALLSKDYIKLVTISLIVAAPLGAYVMVKWLSGFAYHTDLGAGVFVVAGLLAMGIALLTVSLQSVKAALMDPVKSLKSE